MNLHPLSLIEDRPLRKAILCVGLKMTKNSGQNLITRMFGKSPNKIYLNSEEVLKKRKKK